jgi:hypothetical protein
MFAQIALVFAAFTGGGSGEIAARPACPEYRAGRVLVGEFQHVTCDVSPPQYLDVAMFPGRLEGLNRQVRCDNMGGDALVRVRVGRRTVFVCQGVDY